MELKIAFFIIVISVSNVFATPTYSQVAKVSLNMENKSLEQVMDEIESQSEFYFIFNQKQIDVNRVVNIEAENELITDILPELFKGTNVNYAVIDRKILLTTDPLENNLLATASVTELQQQRITGTVTDKVGAPLPGVNVVVTGTTQGTLTDIAGKYSINVPVGAKSLTFSFIGMLPQEISIGTSTQINITMVEKAVGLDEVVVIGYGTVKKTDLTGSVGSVDNASLQKINVTNVGEAISGKLAGVQMRQNEGAPGSTPEFIIRGIGSITAGATPLYVLDGFPIDNLKSISPNSIERIDVLKDASATAIYGSRGSNGVILITTKRGVAGKTNITFNTSFGLQKLLKQPPYMRAADMGRQTYYAILNRNVDDGNDVSGDPRSWKFPVPQISLDWFNGKTTPTEPDVYGTTMPDVNWIDLVMQVAPVQRYDLSVTGGTEAFKYAISGDYTNQDGILRNTNFKRYTLQANFDGQLTKKLKVKVSLNPSYMEDNGPNPSGLGYGTNILGNCVAILPYTPPLKPDGDYFLINNLEESGNYTNAWTLVNELQEFTKRAKFIGNINLEYSILDALKFNVMFAGSFSANKHMFFVPKLPSLNAPNANGTDDTSFGIGWINEYTLNYVKDFGDHHFAALAGFTAEDNRYYSNRLQSIYYPNNLVPYLSATSGLLSGGTADLNEWALVSYLSRVNYTYKDKYYVTTSIRTDGSSRFGSDHRYGVFPSLALAWRISNENFLKDVSFLSNLKLRASYGQTGNNNIGNYESIATVNNVLYPWGNSPVPGFVEARIPNPGLTWEKQVSYNVGLDASILTGRINLTVDNFYTRNKSILLNVNIPSSTGFSTALVNIGEVENKGWEFNLNTRNFVGSFNWTTDFNISFYKNKVLALGPEGDPIINARHITMIGEPIGVYYGLIYDGIFETQAELAEGPLYNPGAANGTHLGDVKFKDLSGPDGLPDGLINSWDRTIIGSPYPDFYYGLTNEFSYNNLSLSVTTHGVYGNEIMSLERPRSTRGDFQDKQLTTANDFWISEEQPGDGNTPRPNDNTTGGIREVSTRLVLPGTYFWINNITLRYEFPSNIYERLNLNALQVYVSTTNPFLFTKNNAFNPDVNNSSNPLTPGEDQSNYPIAKSINFGLRVDF